MITVNNNEIKYISEEGGWVIRGSQYTYANGRTEQLWDVFEIPQYGGTERFIKAFQNHELDKVITFAKTMT